MVLDKFPLLVYCYLYVPPEVLTLPPSVAVTDKVNVFTIGPSRAGASFKVVKISKVIQL